MAPEVQRPSGRAAWTLLPWTLGLLLLVLLAKDGDHFPWALGASAAAALGLGLGLFQRRGVLLDLALVPMLVAASSQNLEVTQTALAAGTLLGLILCGFGHTIAHHAIRRTAAPLSLIGSKAASRLAAAAILTFFIVKGLEWSAPLVSTRWAASLDRSSTAMLVIVGALLLAAGAATTAARVTARRKRATRTAVDLPGPEPGTWSPLDNE